ncbi:MAG: hydrolase [Planctomycetota bacterium]|nr:hydrolase [Planctomycetaceae bacterium]MDQ3330095.1 hydrolase [Planctomycetota bacterium]
MTDGRFARSRDLLSPAESLLFVVDVQERLLPHIIDHDAVTSNCVRLLRAAALFKVPVTLTEQYPKGLGLTVSPIASLLAGEDAIPATRAEKLRFSGAEATGWPAAGERTDSRHQVVLAGIETHICILHTALDLLSMGYRVYVAVDAAGSRHRIDREIALARLRDSGAIVTTTESVLFEWCETAESDQFKSLRDLVATR